MLPHVPISAAVLLATLCVAGCKPSGGELAPETQAAGPSGKQTEEDAKQAAENGEPGSVVAETMEPIVPKGVVTLDFIHTNGTTRACIGTFISPLVAVTAAHCFEGYKSSDFKQFENTTSPWNVHYSGLKSRRLVLNQNFGAEGIGHDIAYIVFGAPVIAMTSTVSFEKMHPGQAVAFARTNRSYTVDVGYNSVDSFSTVGTDSSVIKISGYKNAFDGDDAITKDGDGGAPLFDAQGSMVGVLSGGNGLDKERGESSFISLADSNTRHKIKTLLELKDFSQFPEIAEKLMTPHWSHDFNFAQEAASTQFLKSRSNTACSGIPAKWAEPAEPEKVARGCADFAGIAEEGDDCLSAAKDVLFRRMFTECFRQKSSMTACKGWTGVQMGKLSVAKDDQGKWHVGGSICFFQ